MKGFSLLEVMVALGLFAGAVVTLAGLVGVATSVNLASRERSQATALAWQKMEQILGLAWGTDSDGTERVDLATDLTAWPETAGGTGLSASGDQALTVNTSGFVDYLDADGVWVGTGTSAPPGTAYVRRWSICPSADHPGEALIVRVIVLRAGAPSDAAAQASGFGAVQLTCVKSRRGP
jgi:prepilin-type N-terminal cleavage/methylation domain-containing protein